jgi:hypothetical protein
MALLLIGLVLCAVVTNAWAVCPGCGGTGQTVVCGCDLTGPGHIAIQTLDATSGNVIIPLLIHANSTVQTFQIEVEYPMNLVTLTFVSRGTLTSQWGSFFWTIDGPASLVRISGFTAGAGIILNGMTGSFARLHLTVNNPGCEYFQLMNPGEGIMNYIVCSGSTDAPHSGSEAQISIRVLGLPGDAQQVVYGLHEAAPVLLEVVDLRGRVIDRLVDRLQPVGSHAVPLDTETYGSGVYFVRLESGREVSSAKFVVVR